VALLLRRRGIERVRPLAGGLDAWRAHGFPLEAAKPPAPPSTEVGIAAS
jgi:3-mercaptopyruvate sulfurtransferase SseA